MTLSRKEDVEGCECTDVDIIEIPTLYAENFDQMIKTMGTGVGLAAPQIGINKRFFIMKIEGNIIAVYNPVITFQSPQKEAGAESCLTYKSEGSVNILRAKVVAFNYINWEGLECSLVLKGWNARIFQHEYDHLDGYTIFNRR